MVDKKKTPDQKCIVINNSYKMGRGNYVKKKRKRPCNTMKSILIRCVCTNPEIKHLYKTSYKQSVVSVNTE